MVTGAIAIPFWWFLVLLQWVYSGSSGAMGVAAPGDGRLDAPDSDHPIDHEEEEEEEEEEDTLTRLVYVCDVVVDYEGQATKARKTSQPGGQSVSQSLCLTRHRHEQ